MAFLMPSLNVFGLDDKKGRWRILLRVITEISGTFIRRDRQNRPEI